MPKRAEKPIDQTGAYLRQLRTGRGMTQADLARATGIKQSVVSDLELGNAQFSWYYCKLLAPVFGVAVTDLASATDLLPPEILVESQTRLTALQVEHPDLLAFLARVGQLPPDARHRFNLALRHLVELEEELNAENGRPPGRDSLGGG